MLLSASFLSLEDKKKIKDLAKEQIDYLHLDIMDGRYVTNKTIPFRELKKYLKEINKPFDIHLMVEDVFSYVKKYQGLNPEIITFHLDNNSNHHEIIKYLKSRKIKVGIAIKPEESIRILDPYLDEIDLVLIMSVNPGRGGQKFMPEVLTKVTELKEKNILIEIDGGINDTNIKLCHQCDMVVVGSYITNGNFKEQIEKLRIS